MTERDDWHARMEALLTEFGPDRVAALSFHVPSGFLFMAQAEVDRIHNESEALRIERDQARGDSAGLREAARKLISAYMAAADLTVPIMDLEAAAGLRQQEGS